MLRLRLTSLGRRSEFETTTRRYIGRSVPERFFGDFERQSPSSGWQAADLGRARSKIARTPWRAWRHPSASSRIESYACSAGARRRPPMELRTVRPLHHKMHHRVGVGKWAVGWRGEKHGQPVLWVERRGASADGDVRGGLRMALLKSADVTAPDIQVGCC